MLTVKIGAKVINSILADSPEQQDFETIVNFKEDAWICLRTYWGDTHCINWNQLKSDGTFTW